MVYRDIISFYTDIMKYKVRMPDEQHLQYNNNKWIEQGNFDILHDISQNVTLVQLMDSVGNVNHAMSIVGYWIFVFNYKKSLPLTLY